MLIDYVLLIPSIAIEVKFTKLFTLNMPNIVFKNMFYTCPKCT